jgi:hypothetical protein
MVFNQVLARVGMLTSTGLALSVALTSTAQAATITGQATGSWNIPGAVSGVNAGDPFTATFTYDDAALQFAPSSSTGGTDRAYQVPLTSLIFKSGTVMQAFTSGMLSGVTTSSPLLGAIVNLFGNFDGASQSASLTIAKNFTGDPSTSFSTANFFVTPKSPTGGSAVNAVASFTGSAFDGIQFAEVPDDNSNAIPEPTTMLGMTLAGLGLAWSKRKQRNA